MPANESGADRASETQAALAEVYAILRAAARRATPTSQPERLDGDEEEAGRDPFAA